MSSCEPFQRSSDVTDSKRFLPDTILLQHGPGAVPCDTAQQMPSTEYFPMVHENHTPVVPEHLTQNGGSLPSMMNLTAVASSSNDSVHNLPAVTNGSNLPNRPRRRQVTMHSSSTRRQRRPNLQNRVPRSMQDIVENLIELLDDHNELVQLFRTARNKMAEVDIPEFKVRLFGVVGSRQHELSAGDSIGAIVFEGGPDVETDFDVVIEQHDRTLKRVNKLNASYMSLQFPLIFFFGEDGYHLGRLLLNRGTTDDPPKKMSMKMQMEPSSSIGLSPDSAGKEIVAGSQDTTLAKLKESEAGQGIIAQSEDVTLANIEESDAGKPLHVRVYRKWTPTNKQGKPVMFSCILIDRQVHNTIL
ncbi:hypothetical protein CTI12_AA297070 [Artemisia annua]|uniref:Helitron helicase-like domain-containing protein n=1 Tax=Artemisia annua TaxID=35608 RepID=A0A2U1N802_ARTAN|nr:hypothetical protein CTI12_AA297070 [Artemisia annua]